MRSKILALAIVLLVVSNAIADMRHPFTILNSRGRPILNATIVSKLTGDTAAVDTATEVGGGLYFFQIDPDSGWSTDVYDIYRDGSLMTGWTAIRMGVPEDPDSSTISPGSISYTDLNLDHRIDYTDLDTLSGTVVFGDSACGIDSTVVRNLLLIPAYDTAGGVVDRNGLQIYATHRSGTGRAAIPFRVSGSGSLLGLTANPLMQGINNWVGNYMSAAIKVSADSSTKGALETATGWVVIGKTLEDTLYISAQPRMYQQTGAAWAGLDSVLATKDTCLVSYSGIDSTDIITLTPYGDITLYIDYREAWGFKVIAGSAPVANTVFSWSVLKAD